MERVKAVVASEFDVTEEDITADLAFSELGADAYDIAELLEALAEEFEIDIPEECADNIETVGDAAACVRKYLRHNG